MDSEIAEIFEVKDGTHHLEMDILLLDRGTKIILVPQVATLTSICPQFLNRFLKFWGLSSSKFSEFLELTQLLYFGRVEADKITKTIVETIFWDT